MIDEYSGPLGPALRDALARLNAEPRVAGVLIVVFTKDGRATVANTIPHDVKVKTLRTLLEVMDPPRILVAA